MMDIITGRAPPLHSTVVLRHEPSHISLVSFFSSLFFLLFFSLFPTLLHNRKKFLFAFLHS